MNHRPRPTRRPIKTVEKTAHSFKRPQNANQRKDPLRFLKYVAEFRKKKPVAQKKAVLRQLQVYRSLRRQQFVQLKN